MSDSGRTVICVAQPAPSQSHVQNREAEGELGHRLNFKPR